MTLGDIAHPCRPVPGPKQGGVCLINRHAFLIDIPGGSSTRRTNEDAWTVIKCLPVVGVILNPENIGKCVNLEAKPICVRWNDEPFRESTLALENEGRLF